MKTQLQKVKISFLWHNEKKFVFLSGHEYNIFVVVFFFLSLFFFFVFGLTGSYFKGPDVIKYLDIQWEKAQLQKKETQDD